jgi:tetratricopeptide (TPR) repeat protein
MNASSLLGVMGLALALSLSGQVFADEPLSVLERAANATTELELENAEKLLASVNGSTPPFSLERARLALHRGDCDTALALTSSPALAAAPGLEALVDVARGCAQAMAAAEVVEDPSRGVWIRLQDSQDRALVPFLVGVASSTRRALAKDLGIVLPRPIRIELVRDLFSLAALSGLPVSAAETTGTVGVARFGRVILISPRATTFGYPWEDTLAHELIHLALARVTRDRAPLWLQEGLAKLHETGWRGMRPFDDQGSAARLSRAALAQGRMIGMDGLGPSIALLPTPDQASLAYAQVTSFVDYWLARHGRSALSLLFLDLRGTGAQGAEPALRSVTGHGLGFWEAEWQSTLLSGPDSGKGRPVDRAEVSVLATNVAGIARALSTGDLLFQRGHYSAAILKYRNAVERAPREASIRWRLARALMGSGLPNDAVIEHGKLQDISGPHAGWYALSGRFSAEARDPPQADRMYRLAIAYDPLSVDAACEGHWRVLDRSGPTIDPALPSDPTRRELCRAALRIPRD